MGLCLPAERLRRHEPEEENRVRLPPDVAKTKDGGLTSTQDVAYTNDNSMARLHSENIPTSTLAATARGVDGFVTTQTDHQGITGTFTRAYTATGITQTATDGRGNTTTTHTDLAGRSISSTDAAGNTTATVYDEDFDQPSVVTNAQGKTSCYKYDIRGRKVAEWGTAIQSPRRLVGGLDKRAAFARRARSRGAAPSQPALFGYDDADNLTALTTFRADSGDITTDPSERTDGDTTTWAYHPAAGVELSKTYADNTQVVKTYDGLIRRRLTAPSQLTAATLGTDAYSYSEDKAPDGRKGDWTNAQHLPEGRGAVRRLRVNICEVFGSDGYIKTAYTYTPYGSVTANGNVTQPIQWSSEYNDSELGLVYYNYRHYNPADGRWTGRDLLPERRGKNLYTFVSNSPWRKMDILGLAPEIPLDIPHRCTKCRKHVYILIGGAKDSKSERMFQLYDEILKPTVACSYYYWTSCSDVLDAIKNYKAVCPASTIILIGHSYGGDTAMDVAERLPRGSKVVLVTLNPVSNYDLCNYKVSPPDTVEYWINAYVAKGPQDTLAVIPAAGSFVAGVITFITFGGLDNTVASLGGKWGHESGANVNIAFSYYGNIGHGDALSLFTKAGSGNEIVQAKLQTYLEQQEKTKR